MGSHVRITRGAAPVGLARASSRPAAAGSGRAGLHAGFTLVELVIVFAIIAILVALAVPSLSGLTRVSSEGA
ncbi:MAG TPA: prepilin-type N-terminal cleavage/methylation domain-containing protein, partial [Phycisphaerae bacterium]|nr:prepilin-type N-terminal cleavage/methylation domain-containing protein [Phycisphaerae bacterium]